MSAPAEALAKFWEDLREKSRVRIEHPELPDTLKSAAGELVATLWTQAQTAAQEGMVAFRAEALNTALEAKTAQVSAENERAAAILQRDQARQAIQVSTDRALQLERELAAERASKESLAIQLEAAGRQQAALDASLTEARRDFAAELEKHRQALARAEERYGAVEKRALLEIDRERTVTAKLQKDLAQARQHQHEAEERYRAAASQFHEELGDARQKLGATEGMLHEMRTRCQQQAEELQSLHIIILNGEAQKALLERDLRIYQENTGRLEKELQQKTLGQVVESGAAKPQKRSRKSIS